jgi:hypothetical protein
MIVGHAVTIRGRLMSILGWRRLEAQTLTAEEALPKLLAGETVILSEAEVIKMHRLWWEARQHGGLLHNG